MVWNPAHGMIKEISRLLVKAAQVGMKIDGIFGADDIAIDSWASMSGTGVGGWLTNFFNKILNTQNV